MAETKLSDMIVPEVWLPYTSVQTTEKTALLTSGIMTDLSDEASVLEQRGGTEINMPFFNDLDGDDEIIDDADDLVINKITTGQDKATRLFRGKVFGASDLSSAFTAEDPVAEIGDKMAGYWARRIQKIALATIGGVFDAATMASLTLDISALTGAAANFDGDSFIDATHRLGDQNSNLSGLLCHSETEKAMKKADLLEYIKPSDDSNEEIPTYMGKVVIVDDGMPQPVADVFDTIIFGQGALGFTQWDPENAVETGREPLKGGGQDYLVHRRHFVAHVRGVKWIGSPVKASASNVELGTAANWQRVYEEKMIRMVRFRHKLAA